MLGEPLLRYETICKASELIKSSRHGVPLRIKTNGLFHIKYQNNILNCLKESGINELSVYLASDNSKQYHDIMCPNDGTTFTDVCTFINNAVEMNFKVTCTTIESPHVNISSVRALAEALGVHSFRSMKYFP